MLQYTGREQDKESGFYYYRARFYDPNTGRFLQKDPEPGKVNFPSTIINSYIYVLNNPVNLLDPTGRDIWGGLALLLSGIVTSVATLIFAPVLGPAVALIAGAIGSGLISASFPAFQNKSGQEIGDAFLGSILGTVLTVGIGAGVGALVRPLLGKTAGIILGGLAGGAFGGWMGTRGRTGNEAIGYGIAGAFFGAFLGGFGAANLSFPTLSPLTPSIPLPSIAPPSAPIGLPFDSGPIGNQPQPLL